MAMKVRYTVVDGEVLSELRGGVKRDYVPDPLGSTVALLDSTQTITDTFSYWPYGESAGRTGTTPTPFQFVGSFGYYQDGTARNYVRARNLDKTKGRWITEDYFKEIVFDQNAYLYTGINPVSDVDILGFKPDTKKKNSTGKCVSRTCNMYGFNVPLILTHTYTCSTTKNGKKCSGGLGPDPKGHGGIDNDRDRSCETQQIRKGNKSFWIVCHDLPSSSNDCALSTAICTCLSCMRSEHPPFQTGIYCCVNYQWDVLACACEYAPNTQYCISRPVAGAE